MSGVILGAVTMSGTNLGAVTMLEVSLRRSHYRRSHYVCLYEVVSLIVAASHDITYSVLRSLAVVNGRAPRGSRKGLMSPYSNGWGYGYA